MEHAFIKAGVTPGGKDLAIACAKYFNDRRWSFEEFDRVTSQARAKMAESGQRMIADSGHMRHANLRQPIPEPGNHLSDDDQNSFVPSAREPIPGSGGHSASDAPLRGAPAVQETPPDEASHSDRDAQTSLARPVREPHSDPAGQRSRVTQAADAGGDRKPSPGGGANGALNPNGNVPPARSPLIGHNRQPNAPRNLADIKRTKQIVKPSIFETCSMRGEPLSNMSRGRLKKMRFTNLVEASLATLILNYGEAPDDTMIPDLITGEQLSKMILEAQEIANAA